jgi:hypothetical protein
LDEAGEILLEQKVATTPEAMKQIFEKIPRGLIAMENRSRFSWGKPAAKGAGAPGAGGTRAKGAIDQQEQSKR